jgi:hypothetical protein
MYCIASVSGKLTEVVVGERSHPGVNQGVNKEWVSDGMHSVPPRAITTSAWARSTKRLPFTSNGETSARDQDTSYLPHSASLPASQQCCVLHLSFARTPLHHELRIAAKRLGHTRRAVGVLLLCQELAHGGQIAARVHRRAFDACAIPVPSNYATRPFNVQMDQCYSGAE